MIKIIIIAKKIENIYYKSNKINTFHIYKLLVKWKHKLKQI